jgi:hypothetical protein
MYQRTERPSSSAPAARGFAGCGGRADRRQVQHDAQRRGAALGAQRLQRQAVAEQQVVRHLHGQGAVLMPGAKTPVSWPSTAITQGSLCVVMLAHAAPRRRAMPRA